MTEIFYVLHNECAKIYFLSCRKPLSKGADSATGYHDCHCLTRCRVDDYLFLKVRHLATFGFAVGVRYVVSNERAFTRDCANFSHKGGI